ncbi:MAG: protein O-mannosyl-transferase family [Candidatus Baltobacteraceae bacterium]
MIASFVIPLSIYAATVTSAPASWDTAEMQGVPYILGIPHPTGFPLFVFLGYLWTHLLPFGTVALRMNLFSAAAVSASCLALYLAAQELKVPKTCALFAALWFCFARPVWVHAARAEVHDVALALSTFALVFLLRWLGRANARDMRVACLLLGLALATHPLAIWLAPAFAIAVLLHWPVLKETFTLALYALAPLTFYIYLPLRSALVNVQHLDPARRLAGVDGGLFWNYNNPSSWHGLIEEVSGSQFSAGHAAFSAWNAATVQPDVWNLLTSLNEAFGAFAIVFAFAGLARLWTLDWRKTLIVLVAGLAIVPFSYSYGVEGDADRYRMICFWAFCLFMSGAAAHAAWDVRWKYNVRVVVTASLLLLWGGETMWNNRATFNNRYDSAGNGLLGLAAQHIPKRTIVVTDWVDATTLAYGAFVDHSFAGRIVVAGWFGEYTHDYTSWLRVRPVYLLGATALSTIPGVRIIDLGEIGGGHHLWQLKRGSTSKRASLLQTPAVRTSRKGSRAR